MKPFCVFLIFLKKYSIESFYPTASHHINKNYIFFLSILHYLKQDSESNKNETTDKGSNGYDSEKEAADGSEKDADSNLSNHSSPNKPAPQSNDSEKEDSKDLSNEKDVSDNEDSTKPSIKP